MNLYMKLFTSSMMTQSSKSSLYHLSKKVRRLRTSNKIFQRVNYKKEARNSSNNTKKRMRKRKTKTKTKKMKMIWNCAKIMKKKMRKEKLWEEMKEKRKNSKSL